MAENTKIEWCDHTFNPWEGCTKVSPGCAHCYAETRNQRFAGGANWGKGAPRRRTSEANWRQPLKWNRAQTKVIATCGGDMRAEEYRNPRVFCASLADWLDDEVPIEWFVDLLCMIDCTPNLDWLLLTKRPENFEKRMREAADFYPGLDAPWGGEHTGAGVARQWIEKNRPPENVSIGATVEDQPRGDERIPLLLQIPARVRFLSCEPLLGPVDLGLQGICPKTWNIGFTPVGSLIHWVICGGESGPKARPMHPDWALSLRDQCQAAGVPFFFKQWGEWTYGRSEDGYPEDKPLTCMKADGTLSWWAGDEDTTFNHSTNYKETDAPIERVGKKAAGALLDGREWKEFPEVSP